MTCKCGHVMYQEYDFLFRCVFCGLSAVWFESQWNWMLKDEQPVRMVAIKSQPRDRFIMRRTGDRLRLEFEYEPLETEMRTEERMRKVNSPECQIFQWRS